MDNLENYSSEKLEELAENALRILRERNLHNKIDEIESVIKCPSKLSQLLTTRESINLIYSFLGRDDINAFDIGNAVDDLFAKGMLG